MVLENILALDHFSDVLLKTQPSLINAFLRFKFEKCLPRELGHLDVFLGQLLVEIVKLAVSLFNGPLLVVACNVNLEEDLLLPYVFLDEERNRDLD